MFQPDGSRRLPLAQPRWTSWQTPLASVCLRGEPLAEPALSRAEGLGVHARAGGGGLEDAAPFGSLLIAHQGQQERQRDQVEQNRRQRVGP